MMSGDRPQDSAPDRNVLFGIAAWQLGLVDRDALMAAMYEWMTDRSRPLPDVLEAAGKLRPDDRLRVEQMVERQIDSRSDAAARTLGESEAAAELSGKRREIAPAAGGEPPAGRDADPKAPTLAPRVETLAGAHRSDVVPAADEPVSAAPASGAAEADDRFEVVRSHARGGLGEVYLARDRQLKREVALKLILPKQSKNETSRIRFVREAEVTGALEHPGIVPVYGLGTRPDGRPYYAMRFIRGESLDEAIGKFHEGRPDRTEGQRALELRNLLARFVALCNTIEYAHSRGVLHRDIKPENVMLGPYGETLVVDWGLARPLSAAAEFDPVEVETGGTSDESPSSAQTIQRPTQMGTVVGTPQFMSPEQATGRLDLMSPASDIYSLGATLYCLLTNQPAFTSLKVREVLGEVAKGRFPKPRQIDRTIPPALEAICLKAMALEPAARYPSAKALADDLEHWMADEPVSALPETEMERAARWMRRHKTWTRAAATTTILVALTAGIAYVREATLHQAVQTALDGERVAHADADKARARAEEQQKRAEGATQRAEEQTKLAEANARRAEEQSRLTLETLKSVLLDVQAKLKNVPAARTTRLEMLAGAVERLRQVARSLETAAEADSSLLRANLVIGVVFLDVGVAEGKGGTEEARKQFERAAEVARKLQAAAPGAPQAAADLADVYQRLGDVEIQTGNRSGGAEAHRRSLELRKQVLEVDPGNAEVRRNLSVSYERSGDAALAQGNLAEAEGHYEQSRRLREESAAATPGDSEPRRDLSVSFDRLGDVALRRGDLAAAEGFYRRSLELRTALAAAESGNLQALRDLSISYRQLGDVAEKRRDGATAEEFYGKYHHLAVRLAAEDTANARLQRDLANSYLRQANARQQAGDAAAALDACRKRADILESLASVDTTNVTLKNELADSYVMLGDLHLQAGEVVAAADALDQYVKLARSRAAEAPDDAAAFERRVDALLRSTNNLIRLGRFQAARELNDELFVMIDRVKLPELQSARDKAGLMAGACEYRGKIELEDLDAEQAGLWFERAVKQMREVEKAVGADDGLTEWFGQMATFLKFCEQAKAVQTPATVPPDRLEAPPQLLDFRAAYLATRGSLKEAEAAADRRAARALDDLAAARRTVLIAGGPAWSRMSPGAGASAAVGMGLFVAGRRWAAIAEATPRDDPQRPRREARAVALLTQAADAGCFRTPAPAAQLRQADDFQSLQSSDDFRALLERVKRDLPGDPAKIMGDF